jgi:hypothetical protein
MAKDNVVVVQFTEPSKAYQALSVLKESAADGRIGLESAAVVERTLAGELRISESADNVGLEVRPPCLAPQHRQLVPEHHISSSLKLSERGRRSTSCSTQRKTR